MKTDRFKKWRRSDPVMGVFFMSPLLILLVLVTLVPIVTAFRYSMHSMKYSTLGNFVGFKNYIDVFTSREGLSSIVTSVIYVAGCLLIVIPLSTILSVLLRNKIKGWLIFRTILILPWVISQTVAALLWKWLLSADLGPIMYIIKELTGVQVDFLNGVGSARLSLIFTNSWNSFPMVMILLLAALQTIPEEYYEAAEVDGCNAWHGFWLITFPLLTPTLKTAVILQSMSYFGMVTLIYTMTVGGPLDGTTTLSMRAYREAFQFWHMDKAAAYSVIIFLCNVLFSLIYLRTFKNKTV